MRENAPSSRRSVMPPPLPPAPVPAMARGVSEEKRAEGETSHIESVPREKSKNIPEDKDTLREEEEEAVHEIEAAIRRTSM